jgi:ABC-2 type transport system ATP-binding protein
LGPNGAENLLMKILTTYIASDEGTALVNGHDVNSIKSRTAFYRLFTGTQSVFDLYVREYLAFNADIYQSCQVLRRVLQMTG